jgi:zinc/manganese transport system substrate-binding protein/manganese/iron transport system substrate-binding protein
LSIVTSTSVLADWVSQVGGEHINVTSLVPIGADSHTYQPGARDVTAIADADLVFRVGLGLEGAWMNDLIQNASADPSRVIDLGESVDPIEFGEDDEHDDEHADEAHEEGVEHADEHEEEDHEDDHADDEHEGEDDHEHGHGAEDPHFWFDPLRAKVAVGVIADRLGQVDPANAVAYASNASAYAARLDNLNAWTTEQVNRIPAKERLLVTSHDSFRYFAARYGFEIVGTVLPGMTTEIDPSPQQMAALVDEIEEHGVKAVFTESSMSDRLALRIAEEAGVTVIPSLYSESLGAPGTDEASYIGMFEYNVTAIVSALE